ncbi:hypothetical protein [Aggregatilinea lenta]|uniref:hypothetical protein n=1 Tax=Aggregatilinea lenta TaxID=913108 RepID=UPI000E5B1DCA|nr:hypothetical protein [Aggregatilinea lenta]
MDAEICTRAEDQELGRGERLDMLEEAREYLEQAIHLIRDATRNTGEEDRAEVYIIPTLAMCVGNDHEYLGSQPYNVEELYEALSR